MTRLNEVYRCEICGNIVTVLHTGAGELVCCGQPMTLLEEHTADQTLEKHVPVVEAANGGIKVTVGSVPHPMMDKHYIEWIEVSDETGVVARKFLKPNDQPSAFFPSLEGKVTAREYCNIHGLWKSE